MILEDRKFDVGDLEPVEGVGQLRTLTDVPHVDDGTDAEFAHIGA